MRSLEIPDAKGKTVHYAQAPAPRGLDEWAVYLERLDTEDTYRTAVDALGQWRCTCPDFYYRHHPSRDGGCKHVEAARDIREDEEREPPTDDTGGQASEPACQTGA